MNTLIDILDYYFPTDFDLQNFLSIDIPFCRTINNLIKKLLPASTLSLKEQVSYVIIKTQYSSFPGLEALENFTTMLNSLVDPLESYIPLEPLELAVSGSNLLTITPSDICTILLDKARNCLNPVTIGKHTFTGNPLVKQYLEGSADNSGMFHYNTYTVPTYESFIKYTTDSLLSNAKWQAVIRDCEDFGIMQLGLNAATGNENVTCALVYIYMAYSDGHSGSHGVTLWIVQMDDGELEPYFFDPQKNKAVWKADGSPNPLFVSGADNGSIYTHLVKMTL